MKKSNILELWYKKSTQMDLTDMQLLASAAFVSYDILLQSGMLQLPYIPIIKIYFSLEVH